MAITVKHKFVSAIPDGADATVVRPSNWNDDHDLTGLGTIAEQNANNVSVTGGTVSNTTLTSDTVSNNLNFTSTTAPSYLEGRVWYDSTEKALAFYNDSSALAVHISQDLIFKVINNTGSTIPNGSPVYITGTSSGQTYPNVALAKADVAATSAVIGLTNGAIANGAFGYVSSQGTIDNVNTSTFTVGQVLYLSPYSAGQLMNTIPPTGITVQVGIATYIDSSAGHIYVKQTTPLAVPASIITGTLGIDHGGTGQTTASAAFNALSPLTTAGDVLYGGTSGAGTRLAIGTAGQVLTVNSGATAPQWSTPTTGTVTSVSVTSANGFAGTVATATSTPAITIKTSITGVIKGDGTAISAATAGTDYSAGTSANTSGLVYSTTTTGALTTATGAQVATALGTTAISGNAANVTGIVLGANGGTGVANTGSTITLGGSLTTSGAFTTTLTATANTAITLPTTGTLATLAGTETLTNKRVTPRAVTTTSSATPTINTDTTDIYGLTAQAVNITSFTTNLSGTPTDGQKLWIYIVGTAARTITWGAKFESSTATLPSTTVTTNRLDIGFVWNSASSVWRCVAVA